MTTLTVVGNTKIADLTGLTFAPGSTMYGFETNYKVDSIDPTTGNATLVGQLVSPYLIGAVTITGCATYITPFQVPTVETGVGINVGQNASPTILNNIIANTETAVWVDATSSTTVLGANLYQNIVNPNINWGTGLGSFPISLASTDPLFVDPANDNFYLAAGSQAIDSSVNSLPDRTGMVSVETSLGEPQSPIIAPSTDLLGQLRTANPLSNNSTSGVGENVYIDRGAIEHIDATGPTSRLGLVEPPANDPLSVTPQWVTGNVTVVTVPAQKNLSIFAIQLQDQGTGVDNTTVSTSQVTVYRSDNPTTPLTDGTDYFYTYDNNNDIIYLTAGTGTWASGYTYMIQLNDDPATSATPGILDMAGNALQPNQPDGTTKYTITLVGGVNFSNAQIIPSPGMC